MDLVRSRLKLALLSLSPLNPGTLLKNSLWDQAPALLIPAYYLVAKINLSVRKDLLHNL